MKDATAGDPVSGIKWTRKSTYRIARHLTAMGIEVSAGTVGRLLKAQGYSLRKNRKNIETPTGKAPDPQRRDRQFHYIRRQRHHYETEKLPVISIDTKSRELIGRFHQSGQRWSAESIQVFDHDFPSAAQGVGIPYGIYDTLLNQGFVSVGTSKDTSAFAVDTIRWWWVQFGRQAYPHAEEILIVADGGGSNGYRTRLWKHKLQEQFCNRVGMKVRVCHYPPGASPSGIPSSTASSPTSRPIGPPNPWRATKQCSSLYAPLVPTPAWRFEHESAGRNTRREYGFQTARWNKST